MDLRLHLMVLWRFRLVLLGGILAGVLAAGFALYSPSMDGGPSLTPRDPQIWVSSTKLLVTQEGFPWGRSVLPGVDPSAPAPQPQEPGMDRSTTRYADPSRLSYLATIYSHFLTSDEVLTLIPDPPPGMLISAQPVKAGGSLSAGELPMIALEATATTPEGAVDLSRKATAALERYITASQTAEKVPEGQRVELRPINNTAGAAQIKGLPKSKAFVAFSAVFALAIALAYVLENLFPRVARDVEQERSAPVDDDWAEEPLFGPHWTSVDHSEPTYPNGQPLPYAPTTESS